MKLDPDRLHHLRRLHRDRKAAFQAANDDRLEQREKVLNLERERQRIENNFGPREAKRLAEIDKKIADAKAELSAMTDRENELAAASTTAGATFQKALKFAQEADLDLPDDLRPRAFGSAAIGEQEVAKWGE